MLIELQRFCNKGFFTGDMVYCSWFVGVDPRVVTSKTGLGEGWEGNLT